MIDIDEHKDDEKLPIPENRELNPTILKFCSNISKLLIVESNTEQKRVKSQEALVHAGKMAAIGRMFNCMNHEIKRPLANMRLLVENAVDLIESGESELAIKNLGMLQQATHSLVELTRQLGAFSRKRELNKTIFSVHAGVINARSIISPKLKAGKHALCMHVGDQQVYADMDRLSLALINLLDNAIDAAAGATDKRIDITANEDGNWVDICVRDYGPGIPQEIMERIFEAFVTTKPERQGLGLGLALSSEVIGEMGGQLCVRNHPMGGAEFCIKLPNARHLQ